MAEGCDDGRQTVVGKWRSKLKVVLRTFDRTSPNGRSPHVLSLLVAASTLLSVGDGLPSVSPRAVGMSAERLAKIDHVVERGISAGGYPGAAVVVGRKGAAVVEKGFGRLVWGGDTRVSPDRTIYDLASLTKVVATTTAIMILYDEGKIRLDDPVVRFLPGFTGGSKEGVTIRHLLTHRSGLPAGRDVWR